MQLEKGQTDAARGSLEWVADHATETEFRAIARLRLAALLLDQGKADEALKQVAEEGDIEFVLLGSTKRGKELAGRVARKLNAGAITDANAVRLAANSVCLYRQPRGARFYEYVGQPFFL